jgi:transposase-like protein
VEDFRMPKSKPPYPADFRARIIELARSGRTVRSLAREFNVTDTTIRSWVRQADLDTGRRADGLTTEEKQEVARLRKENARLREERDILERAAAWFAQESVTRKRRSDS